MAQSFMSKQLANAKSVRHFALIAATLNTLLDKHAGSMGQWNIEMMLSSISTISSDGSKDRPAGVSPKSFEWLCRLVKTILVRHRLRLKGHFHLLVPALQSLLGCLIRHINDASPGVHTEGSPHTSSAPRGYTAEHAKLFSRLLTLVCEPSVASVARSQSARLDSATDAAKRAAGQHMYLVLMSYIKLQLEKPVLRAVREALEPGVYSVLDITPDETRRIMSELMDDSGRMIFMDLMRQFRKFGKWSGV